jgi:hypothetical protein
VSLPAGAKQRVANDWLVGQRVERYDILHRLAAGGMGAVYVARAVAKGGFERLVAIKALHPHLAEEEEFISMLLDEARLAARMRHPNVVATLDVSQWEDLHFLVMDYVEGHHLAGILKGPAAAGERLSVRCSLRMCLDALAGLGHAHELTNERGQPLNLVHRDVSPQNILVGVDGVARLTDFGVAKAEYRLSSTRQGTFKGKLSYTAPETASTAHAEQRSDLFSMGVVLWEALTTVRLFKAENNVAILKKLLEEPIPLPSSVHPDLAPFDPVLAKALARPIEERFQTAGEMLDAVERAAEKHEGIATAREVGELVRKEAAEKLAAEQAAIRAAVAVLEQEPAKSYTTGRHDAIADRPSQPPTIASPATRLRERRTGLMIAIVVVALLALAAVAVVGWQSGLFGPGAAPASVREPAEGAMTEPSRAPTDDGMNEPAAEMAADETREPETATASETPPDETPPETAMDEVEVDPSTNAAKTRKIRRRTMMDDDEEVFTNPYRDE